MRESQVEEDKTQGCFTSDYTNPPKSSSYQVQKKFPLLIIPRNRVYRARIILDFEPHIEGTNYTLQAIPTWNLSTNTAQEWLPRDLLGEDTPFPINDFNEDIILEC